jgi:glycosyltransferase involved in cell wall biosynthesis
VTSITVVVPTRNRRALLLATLGSVLAQRDVEVDVVVVDEGSDDGTAEAVRELDDPRVRLVLHDTAKGLPAARNAGLAVATGEWVAFCDDDDLWAPDKLALQLAAARRAGAVWSCVGAVEIDPELRIVGWERCPPTAATEELLRRNVVPAGGSGVVARTAAVLAVGGFDETLRAAEDWDLWLRLAAVGPAAVVDLPLVGYRIWPGSMSRDLTRMDEAVATVLARAGGDPAVTGWDRELHRYRIKQLLRSGRRGPAARALLALATESGAGRAGDLPKAVLAALAPQWYLRVAARRSTRSVPDTWPEAAQAWLDPLRELAPAA